MWGKVASKFENILLDREKAKANYFTLSMEVADDIGVRIAVIVY
jgi:hypothetical protein